MKRVTLIIFLVMSGLTAFASSIQNCIGNLVKANNVIDVLTLDSSWASLDHYWEFDYSERGRVLFLSDGGRSINVPPEKQSQFSISTDFASNSGVKVRLDNNLLPFKAESFDLVVMNRGLCPCRTITKTCGGLRLERDSIRTFVANVVNILDPKNPNSLAVLTGYYLNDKAIPNVPQLFRMEVESLRSSFPDFEFTEILDSSMGRTDNFIGIAVHKKGTPLGVNLRRLIQPR